METTKIEHRAGFARNAGGRRTDRGGVWAWMIVLLLAVGWSSAASAAGYDELRDQLSASFRAIELSDGILFEPLPEQDELPVVEISGGELWIDGAPATGASLARLGELEEVVRALASEMDVDVGTMAAPPVAPASPEAPETAEIAEPTERTIYKDDQVVVGGNLTIKAHEVARDVVVMGGQLTILGRVNGEAAVIGGSAVIEGEVEGDVAVVGGTVEIGPEARVLGDVATVGGSADIAEGAIVEGEVNEVAFGPGLRIGKWIEEHAKDVTDGEGVRGEGRIDIDYDPPKRTPAPIRAFTRLVGGIFGFLFLCLIASLCLLFLRRPIERMATQARIDPAKSGLVGLVAQVLFVPLVLVLVVVLAVSIIGIPLLVLMPFVILGFIFLAFLGWVAAALELGRFLRSRFGIGLESVFALLVLGLFAIQVWGLVGGVLGSMGRFLSIFAVMFGLFGGVVWYITVTIGLGAALITRAGTQGSDGGDGSTGFDDPEDDDSTWEPQPAYGALYSGDEPTASPPAEPSRDYDDSDPDGGSEERDS